MNIEEEWIYKLVNENHIKDRQSGENQTYEIISYFVNYCRDDDNKENEINIIIIDAPGLRDKKGGKIMLLLNNLKYFLKK